MKRTAAAVDKVKSAYAETNRQLNAKIQEVEQDRPSMSRHYSSKRENQGIWSDKARL